MGGRRPPAVRFFCGAERGVSLLVLAPLEEGPGHVDEQRGLPFGDGDHAQVDLTGQVDGGPGIAEGDGHVDLVHLRVDRAEGGAAQVRVRAEAAGGVGCLGEHLVRGGAVVVLGGREGAAQQQRAVYGQRLRRRGPGLAVQSRRVVPCGGDGGGQVTRAHQGVGDDPAACADRQGVLAGQRGCHAAVGGDVGQARVAGLEQEPGRDVVGVGGERAGAEPVVAGEAPAGGVQLAEEAGEAAD